MKLPARRNSNHTAATRRVLHSAGQSNPVDDTSRHNMQHPTPETDTP